MQTTKADKKELIDWITKLDEQAMLVTLQSIKKNSEGGDFWNDLPHETQKAIDKAKIQLREGKGIPHEEVMDEMREHFIRQR